MKRLIIIVVICLAILGSTSATDQHLICKSVDDVFSSDEQVHSTRRLRGSVQGPPGKLGPKGDKGGIGQKGERGSEGIVDYSTINDRLEEIATSANAELQAKVEKLENEILNFTNVLYKLEHCPEGFFYQQKCYFAKVQSINSRSHGEQICNQENGKLADILNQEHQTQAESYLRGKMSTGQSLVQIWIAPKYEPSAGIVRLSDGRTLSASTLRWYPGYPSGSSTGIQFSLKSDASNSRQGIFNIAETDSNHGVLCEK